MLNWTRDELLNRFITGYVECLLWAENDESTPQGGEPLDANYSAADLSADARKRIVTDCRAFYRQHKGAIADGPTCRIECSPQEYAGHDLWLTRNGHGCGYWDGDWPDAVADRLTAAAQEYGSLSPYVCGGQIELQ